MTRSPKPFRKRSRREAPRNTPEKKENAQACGHNAEPRIGIFWLWNGGLVVEAVPLAEAERYGRFLNYPDGHEDVWRRYQGSRTVPADVDYATARRGRVVLDAVANVFFLYADVCILVQNDLVETIRSQLRLPATTKVGSDEHYRCGRCLVAER
ncbi:MAG TPA: hypothetical protein VH302_00300 [Bryobacteraceae bacterium]|nr:hypothetical protein [Bryobacteraceae bacterium]